MRDEISPRCSTRRLLQTLESRRLRPGLCLLALLNSTLFQWRFKLTSTNNNVAKNELDSMPFKTIDLSDSINEGRQDRIVASRPSIFSGLVVL